MPFNPTFGSAQSPFSETRQAGLKLGYAETTFSKQNKARRIVDPAG
jgi:hypothetical protein